jgi:hypothetical protein
MEQSSQAVVEKEWDSVTFHATEIIEEDLLKEEKLSWSIELRRDL